MSGVTEMSAPVAATGAAIPFDEAVRFIWAEADLLDRLAYRPWLKLWAVDGLYVIPTERAPADPAAVLNIVYDDATMRDARAKRLLSGFSMSSAPPARTARTLSRFVVVDEAPGAITLRGAMIVAEYKYERMRTLAGDVEYRLVRDGEGGLKIARKTVTLLNCDDYQHGIGYLL